MCREIAGTEERIRRIPGVRDRRVRATKVRLYITFKEGNNKGADQTADQAGLRLC